MPRLIVGLLLDDGAREVVLVLTALAAAALLALMLAVATPLVLVSNPGAVLGLRGGSAARAPFGTTAPPTRPSTPADLASRDSVSSTATGTALVETARRYLGVPYVFGGTNPATGLDCSGLVQLVYRQLGFPLPRTAQMQYDATARVAREQLQPGDLVFFARTYDDPRDWVTHVGIYVGNGLQINAPTEGQVVSLQPVFSGFWGAHYTGAGRVRAA